jgi:DNA-directed RNA polymerase specialized sigma24 family protein
VTILSVDGRLGNQGDAEDLPQAAMEQVVSRRGSLRRAEKLVSWFYRLLRNLLVDWSRRQAVQARMLSRLAASEPSRIEPADVLFSEVLPEEGRARPSTVHENF